MTVLEQILSQIHNELATQMLADLRDPDKRGPQLYNVIIRFLKDNGIEIDPPKPDEKPQPGSSSGQLSALVNELPPILQDDEDFNQFH